MPKAERVNAAAQAVEVPATPLVERIADATPEHRPPQGVLLGILRALESDGRWATDVQGVGIVTGHLSMTPLSLNLIGQQVALAIPAVGTGIALMLGPVWQAPAASTPAAGENEKPARLVIEATEGIELRCGESSIILDADGQLQLRGEYITSQASATQRILGGTVHVN